MSTTIMTVGTLVYAVAVVLLCGVWTVRAVRRYSNKPKQEDVKDSKK